jgi:3-hydroxyisobutyrate dehydrogenase
MDVETSMDQPRVGFIGAGQMGRPMVDRLVAARLPITVHARRPEHRAELAAAGIAVSDSPIDLAAASDVLIVCLFNDDQLRHLLLADGVLAALRPGAVLVNHVTGSPSLATELEASAPAGVSVLDVPVSGTAENIRAGRLTLLAGGQAATLDRVKPVLQAYADPILHVGAVGDGQRFKLVNNLLFAVHLRAAAEAANVAATMGIPAADLARVLAECSADSFALRLFAHALPDALVEGARPYLEKDVRTVQDVAAAGGIDLGLLGDLAGWVFTPQRAVPS